MIIIIIRAMSAWHEKELVPEALRGFNLRASRAMSQ